jgi:hypothetical protein
MKYLKLLSTLGLLSCLTLNLLWPQLSSPKALAATTDDVKLQLGLTGPTPIPSVTPVSPTTPAATYYGIPMAQAAPKSGEPSVSGNNSTILIVPVSVPADGENAATVIVTVRNADWQPLAGFEVSLSTNRERDNVSAIKKVTGPDGVALFTISSSDIGASIVTARVGNVELEQKMVVQFTTPSVTHVKFDLPWILIAIVGGFLLLKAIEIWLKHRRWSKVN